MKLDAHRVEKPWGCDVLPAPFDAAGRRIGEIWFPPPPSAEDLLVKYIFTSEKLSVQVHPSDAQARQSGLARGKEECWLVIDAQPGATLGIGTTEALSPERLRETSLSGEIEQLINWKPAKAGDFFYIPAGTVHAIGAGICLVEVQQNADATYRLYDYGRPRELHLEDAMRVAEPVPYPGHLHRHIGEADTGLLVDGPYFRLALSRTGPIALAGTGSVILIPLAGEVRSGGSVATPGECLACEDADDWSASADARVLIARSCCLEH